MIGLPLTILLTLSISLFFFYQGKRFNFIENSIIYMVMTIFITNVITILSLNFKVITLTENPFLFLAVILYRDGMIPLLVLIFINVIYTNFTLKLKLFTSILIFACLNGIQVLLIFWEVIQYPKWNFFYAAIVNTGYLLIGLGIASIVLFLKGVQSNDRRL